MSTRRLLVAASIVSIIGVAIAAAPTTAGGAQTVQPASGSLLSQPSSDGWTTFPEPAKLLNPVTVQVQGTHDVSGGCTYDVEIVLPPTGQPSIEQHEVAENPTSCTMILMQGTPQDGTPEDPVGRGEEGDSGQLQASDEVSGAGSSDPGADACCTYFGSGYYKSRMEDPVGIDVNSVKNSVDWFWNRSIVRDASCAYHYKWLSGDGWGKHQNNFHCTYNPAHTHVHSTSYVHYKNGIFCALTDTDVYYDRNHAFGWADGTLSGRVRVVKDGTCSGLLSLHTSLVRTFP